MQKQIRIATRQSPLAMWQAEHVKSLLLQNHKSLHVDIIGMKTLGDKILDKSLSKIGGKGLFVKELETALLNDNADIAVHSMKDVGIDLPNSLTIGAILVRHSPFDAVVSNFTLAELPENAIVGTSSLRRICQLKAIYPHLVFEALRGNINTRLAKLDKREFDAIILAEAGLVRMGLEKRISERLSPEICLPGIAQGSLGVECRSEDNEILSYLEPLMDYKNTLITYAERGVNEILQGSCQTPIAAFATWVDINKVKLTGIVASKLSNKMITQTQISAVTSISEAKALGQDIGHALMSQGAAKLLAELN